MTDDATAAPTADPAADPTTGPTADPGAARAPAPTRRPQQLLLSFLGALVVDRGLPPIGSRVFLQLLGDLGVGEAAGRATLARMTRRGLLDRGQDGRTARYALTATGSDMLREAARRVRSDTPFSHPEVGWTLLSYSMPESRRDLRHQIRARLTWAGFGGLRDGLWIAPGRVDVTGLLAGPGLDGAGELAEAFHAEPAAGTDVGRLLHRAWDVAAVRAEHERFLAGWEVAPDGEPDAAPAVAGIATGTAAGTAAGRALPALTLLGADWLQLLRTDPGLPAAHLPADWPADRSARTYRTRIDELSEPARRRLDQLLAADARRR